MNATGYLTIVLGLLLLNGVLDLWIDWLNARHVSEKVPEEFEGWIEEERYATSRRYQRDNTRFNATQTLVSLPVTVVFILLGGFGWVDDVARTCGFGLIGTGLVFAGILSLLSMLLSLPFDLYDTFVLEERYGFNRTTAKTFILDRIKGVVLMVLIGGGALSLVLWFFSAVPQWGWVIAWGAMALLQILLSWMAPIVILPLFNKFSPLEPGALRDEIEGFADKEALKLKGIYSIDGSRRSSKANAFFTGVGKSKRIALFDTLINKHPVPELLGVLAHEVGHERHKHVVKGLVMSLLTSGLMFFLLDLFLHAEALYAAFGVSDDPVGGRMPIYAGLFFFGFLYTPISFVTSLFSNMLSRRWEFQADAYAARTTGNPDSLADALKRLSVDALSDLTPHPVKVFLEYSHPPVLERVRALGGLEATDGATSRRAKSAGQV